MNKVRCRYCLHFRGGLCHKKTKGGNPIKVKEKKYRSCDKYKEDAVLVFLDFKKREAKRRGLKPLPYEKDEV